LPRHIEVLPAPALLTFKGSVPSITIFDDGDFMALLAFA
jgi:hypothetical protein